jgi:hypothetical protein
VPTLTIMALHLAWLAVPYLVLPGEVAVQRMCEDRCQQSIPGHSSLS